MNSTVFTLYMEVQYWIYYTSVAADALFRGESEICAQM